MIKKAITIGTILAELATPSFALDINNFRDVNALKNATEESCQALKDRNCGALSELTNIEIKMVAASGKCRRNFYYDALEMDKDDLMTNLNEYLCDNINESSYRLSRYEILRIKDGISEKKLALLKKYHKDFDLPDIEDTATVTLSLDYGDFKKEVEWEAIKYGGKWRPLGW
jgi:hypothetical protein